MRLPEEAEPRAVKRSSRKVCRAFSTSAGELAAAPVVDTAPLDAGVVLEAVVAAGVSVAALAAAAVVTVPVADVVVAVVAVAVEAVLLVAAEPDAVPAAAPAPRVCPKAWKTASMKALNVLSILPPPCAPLLPSPSPSLSADCTGVGALATALLVPVLLVPAALALAPLGLLAPPGPELPVSP